MTFTAETNVALWHAVAAEWTDRQTDRQTHTQGWGVTKYKYFVTILRYFFEYFVM